VFVGWRRFGSERGAWREWGPLSPAGSGHCQRLGGGTSPHRGGLELAGMDSAGRCGDVGTATNADGSPPGLRPIGGPAAGRLTGCYRRPDAGAEGPGSCLALRLARDGVVRGAAFNLCSSVIEGGRYGGWVVHEPDGGQGWLRTDGA